MLLKRFPLNQWITWAELQELVGKETASVFAPLSINGKYWTPTIIEAAEQWGRSRIPLVNDRLNAQAKTDNFKVVADGPEDSRKSRKGKDQAAGARQDVLPGVAQSGWRSATTGKHRV